MSGHSHWSGIKHKKEITDQKRGKVFSKLLKAITAAVQNEPNPDFNPVRGRPRQQASATSASGRPASNGVNPRLRAVIQRAKEANVPVDNIERAIKKASEPGAGFEELIIESYGPGGVAMLIEAIADNKNRVLSEIKKILSDHGAKFAEQGSVRWAFEEKDGGHIPKFPQELNQEDAGKLTGLIEALEEYDDVQGVYTNAKI